MSKKLLAVFVFAASLAACGSPKKSPDSNQATDPNQGKNPPIKQETPQEAFDRQCGQNHGHLIYNGTECRFEFARLDQNGLPFVNGRQENPPVDLHVGDASHIPNVKVLGTHVNGIGIVQFWEKNSGRMVGDLSWEGYKSLPGGDYWVTLKSLPIGQVTVVIEACQNRNFGYVDCDVAPRP